MKQEDFERLKAICEKEGFEIKDSTLLTDVFEIKKRDIWDGVEFCEFDNNYRKISEIDSDEKVWFTNGKWLKKHNLNPSTEQAYIDQLKKEALERFGEIKEGDRFDRSWAYEHWPNPAIIDGTKRGFHYESGYDQLTYNGSVLYEQGKWATRVNERVKVEVTNRAWKNSDKGGYNFEFYFKVTNGGENAKMGDCARFLASQLEKYLKGEIE